MASNHYDKAPIVEALVDLHVAPRPGLTAIDLAVNLEPLLLDTYADRQEIADPQPKLQVTIGSNGQPSVSVGVGLSGFRYTSHDKRRLLFCRLTSFTLSIQCDPTSVESRYDRWEVLRDEAYRLWAIYKKACEPLLVTRAAVRYINRFDLPSTRVELQDYFKLYPHEPQGLKYNDIHHFVVQTQMRQPDIEATAILNQATVPPVSPDMLSVLLDIDLFREQLNWEASRDDMIWDYVEKLHARENEIFEACITDKAREVIR